MNSDKQIHIKLLILMTVLLSESLKPRLIEEYWEFSGKYDQTFTFEYKETASLTEA